MDADIHLHQCRWVWAVDISSLIRHGAPIPGRLILGVSCIWSVRHRRMLANRIVWPMNSYDSYSCLGGKFVSVHLLLCTPSYPRIADREKISEKKRQIENEMIKWIHSRAQSSYAKRGVWRQPRQSSNDIISNLISRTNLCKVIFFANYRNVISADSVTNRSTIICVFCAQCLQKSVSLARTFDPWTHKKRLRHFTWKLASNSNRHVIISLWAKRSRAICRFTFVLWSKIDPT